MALSDIRQAAGFDGCVLVSSRTGAMMGLGNGAVERAQRPKPEDAGTIWGVAESLQRQQPEYIFEKNKHFVTLSANAISASFLFREQP